MYMCTKHLDNNQTYNLNIFLPPLKIYNIYLGSLIKLKIHFMGIMLFLFVRKIKRFSADCKNMFFLGHPVLNFFIRSKCFAAIMAIAY